MSEDLIATWWFADAEEVTQFNEQTAIYLRFDASSEPVLGIPVIRRYRELILAVPAGSIPRASLRRLRNTRASWEPHTKR